jgi:hypothetical protein
MPKTPKLPSAERCNYTTTNFSQHNNKIGWTDRYLTDSNRPGASSAAPRENFEGFSATLFFMTYSILCRVLVCTPKGVSMQMRKLQAIVLTSAFTALFTTGVAIAQDGAKQDMKAAGTDTKNAAKDTGHAVSTGTKKTYNKTASGTKTVYHKTANGTKTATDKTVDGTKTVGKDVGHGTKVAAKDTANGTKKVGDKIAGKPTPQ